MTADLHAPMSAFRQITSALPPEADIPVSPRGSHQIAEILQGVKFKDGEKLTES